jgi:hypothetical protein
MPYPPMKVNICSFPFETSLYLYWMTPHYILDRRQNSCRSHLRENLRSVNANETSGSTASGRIFYTNSMTRQLRIIQLKQGSIYLANYLADS